MKRACVRRPANPRSALSAPLLTSPGRSTRPARSRPAMERQSHGRPPWAEGGPPTLVFFAGCQRAGRPKEKLCERASGKSTSGVSISPPSERHSPPHGRAPLPHTPPSLLSFARTVRKANQPVGQPEKGDARHGGQRTPGSGRHGGGHDRGRVVGEGSARFRVRGPASRGGGGRAAGGRTIGGGQPAPHACDSRAGRRARTGEKGSAHKEGVSSSWTLPARSLTPRSSINALPPPPPCCVFSRSLLPARHGVLWHGRLPPPGQDRVPGQEVSERKRGGGAAHVSTSALPSPSLSSITLSLSQLPGAPEGDGRCHHPQAHLLPEAALRGGVRAVRGRPRPGDRPARAGVMPL